METRVIYQLKSNLKNPKLSIIQYLINQGVMVDSIQCDAQELKFISKEECEYPDEKWSDILNKNFKGKIDFHAKRPSGQLQAK